MDRQDKEQRYDPFWGIDLRRLRPSQGNLDCYFPEGIEEEVELAAERFWRRRGRDTSSVPFAKKKRKQMDLD